MHPEDLESPGPRPGPHLCARRPAKARTWNGLVGNDPRTLYRHQSAPTVLLFEFFPAFVAIVSIVVGVWLYVVNRNAPDESARQEQLRREVAERAAAAKDKGPR
jgi:hypothetical protein